MQESTNIYQRARERKGITQERAAERLGISVESVKAYEGDRRLPPDGVVKAMVDVYDYEYLAYQHLARSSELGRALLPKTKEKRLAEAALSLLDAIPDLDQLRTDLIAIAKDGRIDDDEWPVFSQCMSSLEDLSRAYYELKFHRAGEA